MIRFDQAGICGVGPEAKKGSFDRSAGSDRCSAREVIGSDRDFMRNL